LAYTFVTTKKRSAL